jgi:hypothetical protein
MMMSCHSLNEGSTTGTLIDNSIGRANASLIKSINGGMKYVRCTGNGDGGGER